MRMGDYSLEHRSRPGLFSLVLPAYNPGTALEQTLRDLQDFLAQVRDSWEVLIVCDGCTDGTPERLRLWAECLPNLRVLSYTPNRGKGHALRTGLRAARGTWRIFTDIDLSYPFADVLRVAESLRTGAEMVIASRRHAESRLVLPPNLVGAAYRRHLQSLLFSRLVRLCLPLGHGDTQAGLKGMSARVADAVVPLLGCDGFGFDCELLTACTRYGIAITEVPVSVRYEQASSTVSPWSMVRTLRELWKIRRAWRHAPPLPLSPPLAIGQQKAA
jgi:dolichyl-phosphate beta-glucosyltransferase